MGDGSGDVRKFHVHGKLDTIISRLLEVSDVINRQGEQILQFQPKDTSSSEPPISPRAVAEEVIVLLRPMLESMIASQVSQHFHRGASITPEKEVSSSLDEVETPSMATQQPSIIRQRGASILLSPAPTHFVASSEICGEDEELRQEQERQELWKKHQRSMHEKLEREESARQQAWLEERRNSFLAREAELKCGDKDKITSDTNTTMRTSTIFTSSDGTPSISLPRASPSELFAGVAKYDDSKFPPEVPSVIEKDSHLPRSRCFATATRSSKPELPQRLSLNFGPSGRPRLSTSSKTSRTTSPNFSSAMSYKRSLSNAAWSVEPAPSPSPPSPSLSPPMASLPTTASGNSTASSSHALDDTTDGGDGDIGKANH